MAEGESFTPGSEKPTHDEGNVNAIGRTLTTTNDEKSNKNKQGIFQ